MLPLSVPVACYGCGTRFIFLASLLSHCKEGCAGWRAQRKRVEDKARIGDYVLYRGEWWRVLTIEEGRMDGLDTADIEGVNETSDIAMWGFEDIDAIERVA